MARLFKYWCEWKQFCALDLCSEPARQALTHFGSTRFSNCLRKYLSLTNLTHPDGAMPGAGDCWHLFESFLQIKSNKGGKRYKDWLFHRAKIGRGSQESLLASGASLLMRDVVRDYLRKEFPNKRNRSLQVPTIGTGTDTVTLEDLIPGAADPADEAGLAELEEIAKGQARDCFDGLDRRFKIAMAARGKCLSLSDPVVERAAGCTKSTIYLSLRAGVEGLVRGLQREFNGEDPETVRLLMVLVLDGVKKLAVRWFESENEPAEPFNIVKGRKSSKKRDTVKE